MERRVSQPRCRLCGEIGVNSITVGGALIVGCPCVGNRDAMKYVESKGDSLLLVDRRAATSQRIEGKVHRNGS